MHSLSERYQLTENIKLTRLLAPVLISNVVVSLINVTTVAYYLLLLPYDPHRDVRIVGYIVDWSIAIFTAVTPWMILLRHPPYLRKLRSALHYKAAEVACAGPPRITNINGENISIQQEAGVHFKILSRSWL
ncbi:putative G-protein coupled receptor F27E5.8 [Toxocara canis]|uniref:Putative G-protein coupled receptor F27E5.8 n=1 Tax=Toxocara canis TaxID=6265 RepID=A0A0B2UXJ3_TOXCA|nr:putative G-protein coupled receptor F27E5.8 [Toxocara canis]